MNQGDRVNLELKKFFKQKGLSQQKIAEILGTSQQYVQKLLKNGTFSKGAAQKFADNFGLSAAWLITGEGAMLQDSSQEITTFNVVGSLSDTVAAEILKLVSSGTLYPASVVEEKNQIIREQGETIQQLNREIGSLRAQLVALGAEKAVG